MNAKRVSRARDFAYAGPKRMPMAMPAANARNDSTAMTGTGGHGVAAPVEVPMGMCGAALIPACPACPPWLGAAAAIPAGRTVIMPCLRWWATSHQFIG